VSVINVCKNVIQSNNKRKWVDPDPAIRVATSKCGKVTIRSSRIGIVDKDGNVVAEVRSTIDGKPIVKCGAKVAVFTEYDAIDLGD